MQLLYFWLLAVERLRKEPHTISQSHGKVTIAKYVKEGVSNQAVLHRIGRDGKWNAGSLANVFNFTFSERQRFTRREIRLVQSVLLLERSELHSLYYSFALSTAALSTHSETFLRRHKGFKLVSRSADIKRSYERSHYVVVDIVESLYNEVWEKQ